MSITVSDVLKLKGFGKATIAAGKEGASNILQKATLMEVPDIFPYLEEQSLIITTLYPIVNNQEAMQKLIPRISGMKAAGICIKPGRYIDNIPQVMLDQANELNFPVIQLNEDNNLSDLVSEIISVSLDKNIEVLNYRNMVHKHLMDLFLMGEDIDSLVDNFSNLVNSPILLLDKYLQILSASKDVDKSAVSIEFLDQLEDEFHLQIKVKEKEYSERNYIIHSIKAGKTKFGFIILLDESQNNKNLKIAVEEASLLIASAFYKNQAVLEKEKNFQDSFIRDLLQGETSSQIEAITKAHTYGWNMEFPQVIMSVKIFHEDDLVKKESYEKILNSHKIEKILKNILYVQKQIKMTYINEAIVIFINVAFINDIKEKMILLGNLIKETFQVKYHIGVGISNTVLSVDRFSEAYKEANSSLAIGRRLNQKSFSSHYDDLKMFHIIKEVSNTEVLNKYVNDILGKILTYDHDTDMDLMKTLVTLIEENFNLKKTAGKLFIHYNTLRYRLEKLKAIGINIDNGLEIVDIILAYNTYLWLESNN